MESAEGEKDVRFIYPIVDGADGRKFGDREAIRHEGEWCWRDNGDYIDSIAEDNIDAEFRRREIEERLP